MRFQGFEEDWENVILSELGDFIGGGTPASANLSFWKGSIPWISSSDIDQDNVHNIRISRFISQEAIDNSATKYCLAPVITIVSRVGVGKVAYSKEDLCTSQDFTNIINVKCNGLFLTLLLSRIMKAKAASTQGTSIKGITSKEIKEIRLCLPKKTEQEKIVSFFSLIDGRIQTQNKIIKQLEALINAIYQAIIQANTPNAKLKDCVICNSSSLTETEVLGNNGTYPVYGARGIIAYTSNNQIDEDAILIIKDGAGVGKVQYGAGKFSVIGTLNYLTTKQNISLKYIYYCLQFLNFDKYRVGSGIPHIYFKDYGEAYIYCPPFEDQKKIALILSSIDEKLKIEIAILRLLIKQKQYFLQNLFI